MGVVMPGGALADLLRGVQLERSGVDGVEDDVRSVATSCVSVHPSTHARLRQAERGLSKKQIQCCLKHGSVHEGRNGRLVHVFGPTTVVVANNGRVVTAWGRPAMVGVLAMWNAVCMSRDRCYDRIDVIRKWKAAVHTLQKLEKREKHTLQKLEKREKHTQRAASAVEAVEQLLAASSRQHSLSPEEPFNIKRRLQKRQIAWKFALYAVHKDKTLETATRLEHELELTHTRWVDAERARELRTELKREAKRARKEDIQKARTRQECVMCAALQSDAWADAGGEHREGSDDETRARRRELALCKKLVPRVRHRSLHDMFSYTAYN